MRNDFDLIPIYQTFPETTLFSFICVNPEKVNRRSQPEVGIAHARERASKRAKK